MFQVIVFFAGFFLAVIIAEKLKLNPGLLAMIFGLILAWTMTGGQVTTSAFIGFFPASLFLPMFATFLFFGAAMVNGTMEHLSKTLLYLFRGASWAIVLAVFLITMLLSFSGMSTNVVPLMAPIAWSLLYPLGINPLLIVVTLWAGSQAVVFVPHNFTGAALPAFFSMSFPEDQIPNFTTYQMNIVIWMFIAHVVIFAVYYVMTKGWVLKGSAAEIQKPEPMNKEQKLTLGLIIMILVVLLCPIILSYVVKSPILSAMTTNVTIVPLCLIATAILLINSKTVTWANLINKNVPWGLLFTLCGMAMYCSLCVPLGVPAKMAEILSNVPAFVVPAIFCIVGAALSFVTNALTVGPLLFALMPTLTQVTGLSYTALLVPASLGMGLASVSPFSSLGAWCLIGSPQEIVQPMMKKQLAFAVIVAAITSVVSLTGIFGLGLS